MSIASNQARELPPNPEAPVQRSIPVTGQANIRGGSSRANVVAEEAIQQGEYRLFDEAAAEVTRLFLDFLHTFTLDDATSSTGQTYPYQDQVLCLVKGASSMQHLLGIDDNANLDESNESLLQGEISSSFPRTLFVDFHHVYAYDVDLAEAIESDYTRFESSLRQALQSYLRSEHFDSTSSTVTPLDITREREFTDSLQIAMINMPALIPIRRAVRTENIARLTSICGTVTRSSDVRPELLIGAFRCSKCSLDTVPVPQQYHYTRPTVCRNPRCDNRTDFQLQFDKSIFTDWQKLRVQENSNEIPPGSMPRSLDIIVRGDMVERAKAGDRIIFTGSLVVIPDASALARAGDAPRATRNESRANDAATGGGGGARLKSLGVRELTYRTCFVSSSVMPLEHLTRYRNLDTTIHFPNRSSSLLNSNPSTGHCPLVSFFHGHWSDHGRLSSALGRSDDEYRTTEEVILEMTDEEQDDVRRMRSTSNLLQKMCQSLAPYTYGHDDIKRGILLQLLGGVHKTTSEGMKLRGDINICIVGDPSTAKSQFLKFVHSFLPNRSVYTSGKASSAAGLTAAVQRDQDSGEFCIEAGALMLADNGICCIDEFDKMDPHDQVAIHEAMEQQTISITKAGIQATLNARASILAAANPIYGRYDRTKTLKANVSLGAPILSRFDLFFVVLDNTNETSDYHVAKHILDVHRCEEQVIETPFSIEQMQRYIRFAKTINPKLSEESRRNLIQYYRMLRQNDAMGRGRTAYRITVRQLESLVRLSEAMARLFCDEVVRPQYVRDAYRLLQKSIIHVETDDVTFEDEDELQSDEILEEKRGEDCEIGPKPDEHTVNGDSETVEKVSAETSLNEKDETGTSKNNDGHPPPSKRLKRSKKKVKISYEDYDAMMKTFTTYLCSRERKDDSLNLTWGEVLEWYLEQRESEISDDEEALNEMRRLAILVFRRMVQVDRVIIFVSDEEDELNRRIAVHPNFPR